MGVLIVGDNSLCFHCISHEEIVRVIVKILSCKANLSKKKKNPENSVKMVLSAQTNAAGKLIFTFGSKIVLKLSKGIF